jgi:hypothetical protein
MQAGQYLREGEEKGFGEGKVRKSEKTEQEHETEEEEEEGRLEIIA